MPFATQNALSRLIHKSEDVLFLHTFGQAVRCIRDELLEIALQINVLFIGIAVAIKKAYYSASENQCDTERKENNMEVENQAEVTCSEEPRILEEIQVEELAIDGICGVY